MKELVIDNNGIWIDKSERVISYPKEANEALFAIEDNSFWFKHRNQIIKSVIERFPFSGNYADIGGGNGLQVKFISENFKKTKTFLIEPGYQGCLNAKKRGVENIFNISFQKFDFKSNNICAVGLYDVIEHIENDVEFLTGIKSALPPGSMIYITVPAHNYLWSDADDYGGHFRRYNMKMIGTLADKLGVELVFSSYFFSYIPFITYFLKHLPYKLRKKRSNHDILDSETKYLSPSGTILKFFDLFHGRELNSIRKKKIRHGGSCIAVFRT